MLSASSPRPAYGPRGRDLCRPGHGADAVARPRSYAATPSTSPLRQRNWRRPCPRALGTPSLGARAPMRRSPHALPPCASGRQIGIIGALHHAPRNGSWSNGHRASANRSNTGSRPCQRTQCWPTLSTRPSSDGASNGTTRNSSRRSASVTTKAEGGEASTITPRSQSLPTPSWSVSGAGFPPQGHVPRLSSKHLAYPEVIDRAAPPLRPERHVANSIATIRISLAHTLASQLARCPCCRQPFVTQ